MEDIEWSEESTEDLAQKMYDLISEHVRDSDARIDMLDILYELEDRID